MTISGDYFRGGSSLKPKANEIRLDPRTGLVKTTHGVSVYSRPDSLDRFGGAHRVTNVPAELTIIRRGKDPFHHEIVPTRPMTLAEYEEALGKIILIPV
jgi:hypothetical protein